MKNSEEAIERVLAGLRDVEAPDGMQRRILDGLEGRAATQARSDWRRSMPMRLVMPRGRWELGWGLISRATLAGVLVLAFAIPAMRRAARAPVGSKIDAAGVKVGPMSPSVIATGDVERASPGRGGPSKRASDTPEKGLVREAASDDSVALSETQAASFPAPPMPLTEQERLLLRLVHKVDPVEIAMLDPRVRAIEDAEEKEEFQRFFGKQSLPAEVTTEESATGQVVPQQSTTELASPEQSTIEQARPKQPAPEQSAPDQPTMEQPTPDQPVQEPSKPQKIAPDQSTTQQLTATPIRTGENE
jgi:hypothetical protein